MKFRKTREERLNLIGAAYTVKSERDGFAKTATLLREIHRGLQSTLRAHDDLLKLADQLDTLAMPIVVEQPLC